MPTGSTTAGCVLEPGLAPRAPLPTDAGRCVVPHFSPSFSFEPQAGWVWSVTPVGDRLLLETGPELADKVEFYRYGGAVVTDSCATPPETAAMSDVNDVWAHLDSLDNLQMFAIGRSVGPNPAWQFDLRGLAATDCPATPVEETALVLWTTGGGHQPEILTVGDLLSAYFILVGEDVVVMTADAGDTAAQRDFEVPADAIFESLSFDDVSN